MNDDRNYYRMLGDDELIELTKSIKTNELALVLAERLKKLRNKTSHWDTDSSD